MLKRKLKPIPSREEALHFREIREQIGTQIEVAKKMPCSPSAISHWENAQRAISPMAWVRLKDLLKKKK